MPFYAQKCQLKGSHLSTGGLSNLALLLEQLCEMATTPQSH